jgi:RNA polymerase sigma-70 factor (ECF subfamily)
MEVDRFEVQRAYLFGIAYRMLGSAAEAEDILQEASLRWCAAPRDDIRSDRAWLSTVVTRLCLDQLESARVRRESYVGPWLPEPIHTDEHADAESISLAFLLLLERLSPLERAVYLLHEVFEHSHAEIAETLGRSEDACRQLLHRARKAVQSPRPRYAPSKQAHARLLASFAQACERGDAGTLQQLLVEDVTAWSDGGGKATAARRPIVGIERVARAFIGLRAKAPAQTRVDVVEINGWPALLVRVGDVVASCINIETDGERIFAIRSIVNPDKLVALA